MNESENKKAFQKEAKLTPVWQAKFRYVCTDNVCLFKRLFKSLNMFFSYQIIFESLINCLVSD